MTGPGQTVVNNRWERALLKAILAAAFLALVALLAWAFDSRDMPALRIWHTAVLQSEFTARDAMPRATLGDYLEQEERLFRELQDKIYGRVAPTDEMIFSRYRADGPQDPNWGQRNWNRTFELVPPQIKGGALLLHGITDSPYSLRRIGEIFYAKGYYVLGLRLPGHGTIPGALTRVHWEDWVAASRLGARHVRDRIGEEQPLVIAGYSNGGALAVKYALDALDDPSLSLPDRLLLFSPQIGIEPLSSIANTHKLLSFLPYFAKFKWLSIEPEYDPFKYNSFPKDAAQEAWQITATLWRQLQEAYDNERFEDFPSVLTFLSWADATVKTPATIRRLYGRLRNESSELIIFDINRLDALSPFFPAANELPLDRLEARADLPYRLTIITNVARDSAQVEERTKAPRSGAIESKPLHVAWPQGVYSLTHVAIPFAPDDQVYGTGDGRSGTYDGLALGALRPQGEIRFLVVPLSKLMRLRHNPFYAYVEQRIIEEIDKMP